MESYEPKETWLGAIPGTEQQPKTSTASFGEHALVSRREFTPLALSIRSQPASNRSNLAGD